MSATPTKTLISTHHSSRPRPAQRGCPAGTDYFTTEIFLQVWPEDGTKYAGKRYHDRWTWIGPKAGMKHVVIAHDNYPENYYGGTDLA